MTHAGFPTAFRPFSTLIPLRAFMPGAQCGDPRRGPGTGRSSAAPCQGDPPPQFGSGVFWGVG